MYACINVYVHVMFSLVYVPHGMYESYFNGNFVSHIQYLMSSMYKGEESQDRPKYMNFTVMHGRADTDLSVMLNKITALLQALYEEDIEVKLEMGVYKSAKKVY